MCPAGGCVIFDWASFALGAVACIVAQWLWAATHISGFVLRVFRKSDRAQLIEDLFIGLLIVAVLVVFTLAVREALFMTAVSIRRGVF
jgi:hypothetical protein